MIAKDGRAIARENELRVLRSLHRFGWLRTRDLALLVWQRWAAKAPNKGPDLKPRQPTEAALRMAQRTLRRLRESRQVLSSRAPNGSTLCALATTLYDSSPWKPAVKSPRRSMSLVGTEYAFIEQGSCRSPGFGTDRQVSGPLLTATDQLLNGGKGRGV